jgi:hypothetical protein
MPEKVLVTKVANALITGGEMRPGVVDGLSTTTGIELAGVEGAVKRSAKKHGGIWVGGRVTLTSTRLSFQPNAMNRAVTSGPLQFTVDLAFVTEIQVESAFITDIITLLVGTKAVKVRCRGADAFAQLIRQQVTNAGTASG